MEQKVRVISPHNLLIAGYIFQCSRRQQMMPVDTSLYYSCMDTANVQER